MSPLRLSAVLAVLTQASFARAAAPPPFAPAAPPAAPADSPAAPAPVDNTVAPASTDRPAVPAPVDGPAAPAPVDPVAPPPIDRPAARVPVDRSAAPLPAASPAPAPRDAPVEPDDGVRGTHQLHFYAGLGVRASFIHDRGYQPFSTDSGLAQFSAMFGRVLFTDSALSFGIGAGWDYGSTSATVRTSPTELSMHRVTLMPEVRYHLIRRLYAFGRVGAGLAVLDASYSDAIVGSDRTDDQLSFTVDPALGAAFEIYGAAAGNSRQPRLWFVADAGYLFTSKMDLVLASDSETPARTQPVQFGQLGLSGVTLRGMAALSF